MFNGTASIAWQKCAKTVNLKKQMCQRKAIASIWQEVLADVDTRNTHVKSIMLKSTDFLRHVVSEKKEGRCATTFTYVCEHCKFFQLEDLQWWTSANHGEKKKKTKKSNIDAA